MSRPGGLSTGDARALVRAHRQLLAGIERQRLAHAELAQALADAQAKGYSVRTLAQALDVQPTTVQRLIAGTKR